MLKEVHEQTEKHEDEMQLYANDLTRELWKRVLGIKKILPSVQEGDNTKSAVGTSGTRKDGANVL